jgi:hypothetical protein
MRAHRLAALLLTLFALTATYAAPEAERAAKRRPQPPPAHWFDRAHGHDRRYPITGVRVRTLPPHATLIVWADVRYWFVDGVWYAPAAGGCVVVRPPLGVVVPLLPPFRTAVVIGGVTYFYVNGVYYRERAEGGYEVVAPPYTGVGTPSGAPGRLYVYPRQGQTPERQAEDEYECHRWAVSQTGFDPAPAALGQPTDTARRGDYVRALTACLEARGYTVR